MLSRLMDTSGFKGGNKNGRAPANRYAMEGDKSPCMLSIETHVNATVSLLGRGLGIQRQRHGKPWVPYIVQRTNKLNWTKHDQIERDQMEHGQTKRGQTKHGQTKHG